MELEDLAAPLLREVHITQDANNAFAGSHVLLLLDYVNRQVIDIIII